MHRVARRKPRAMRKGLCFGEPFSFEEEESPSASRAITSVPQTSSLRVL